MSKFYEVVADSQNRPVWLEARQTGLGASEAAGVLGISPWQSHASIAADKLIPIEDQPENDNEFMASGRWLEPVIGERFVEETEKKACPAGLLLRSIEYPWLLATPDWWVFEPVEGGGVSDEYAVPLQIKNTGRAQDWDDGVPAYVQAQVQQEMIVTGAPHAYVAVLITGNRFRWAKVDANVAFQADIIAKSEKLWKDITEGNPIETDGKESTSDALKALFPEEDPEKVVDLPGELMEAVEKLEEIKSVMRVAMDSKREVENQIRAAMGDAAKGVLPDGSGFTLKTQHRKAHEVKASSSRVLRRVKA